MLEVEPPLVLLIALTSLTLMARRPLPARVAMAIARGAGQGSGGGLAAESKQFALDADYSPYVGDFDADGCHDVDHAPVGMHWGF